jgi:AraC-like DNA-binding protein
MARPTRRNDCPSAKSLWSGSGRSRGDALQLPKRIKRSKRYEFEAHQVRPAASLGQIAADCGFTDQAHLSNLFRRFVGESPGVWRRARATAPA